MLSLGLTVMFRIMISPSPRCCTHKRMHKDSTRDLDVRFYSVAILLDFDAKRTPSFVLGSEVS